MKPEPNVQEAIPFFWVKSMEKSLGFYKEGLGFELTNQWIHEGQIRWCRLQIGKAAVMLQEFWKQGINTNYTDQQLGLGIAVYFICQDALAYYHEVLARGVPAGEPFVGNNMWVTRINDPDGYPLYFESFTDTPEGTTYTDWKRNEPA